MKTTANTAYVLYPVVEPTLNGKVICTNVDIITFPTYDTIRVPVDLPELEHLRATIGWDGNEPISLTSGYSHPSLVDNQTVLTLVENILAAKEELDKVAPPHILS
jgi:hypothetical protein